MRSLSTSADDMLRSRSWIGMSRPIIFTSAVVVLAVLIGMFIGLGNWTYVLLLCLLPIFLRAPVLVAFGAFLLLIPFEPLLAVNGQSRNISIDSLVGLFASIVFLTIGSATGRLKPPPHFAFWWVGFALWAITTTLWAVDAQVAIHQLPGIFAAVLLYLASASLQFSKVELRFGFKVCVTAAFAAALVAIYQFYSGRLFGNDIVGRGSLIVGAEEVNPNLFAFTLMLPFAAAIAWFLDEVKWHAKLLVLAMLGPISLAILLSMSRSAFLSLAIIVLLFLYRHGKSWRALVPASLISLLLLAVPRLFFSRLQEAAKTGGSGRVDVWSAGLRVLAKYGLWGAGANNFGVVYTNFSGYAPHFMGYIRDSHNVYLQVGVDFGLTGLVLFCAAIVAHLRELALLRKGRIETMTWLVACEAACYALLFCEFFSNDLWRKHFWLPWILLTCMLQMRREGNTLLPVTNDDGGRLDLLQREDRTVGITAGIR